MRSCVPTNCLSGSNTRTKASSNATWVAGAYERRRRRPEYLPARWCCMEKRVFFEHRLTPYLLVAAQLAITLIFFIWPAAQAFYQSTISEDAFGLSTTFVGLAHFAPLFAHSL